tara:strand:- start:736 stop:1524 length:789 start_codon:yes stop_codon:yes gene_type:complete
MLSLNVDMSEFDAYLQALVDTSDGIAASAAQVIYEDWRSLAERRLKSSREQYLDALQPPRAVATGFEISLVGTFPVWVEEGKEPYDVGQVILKGREYVRVPFKQNPAPSKGTTPAFGGSSTPMGYGYRAKPRGVDSRAGALASVQAGPGAPARLTRRVYGGGPSTPSGAYTDWRRAGRRAEAGANLRKLYAHHSRPLYGGQVHDAHSGVGGVTFRTVNQDSNWIHPGIQGRRLADEAVRRFGGRNLGLIVSKHIQGLGGPGV